MRKAKKKPKSAQALSLDAFAFFDALNDEDDLPCVLLAVNYIDQCLATLLRRSFREESEAAEQIKAGKLRALATASGNRIKPLPDLPTVAESGYANYESEVWLGLLAPAKNSAVDISQLANLFVSAMKAPGIEAKLLALGLYPTGLCGKDFSEFIRRKNEQYDRNS